jgi:hypothetical protein
MGWDYDIGIIQDSVVAPSPVNYLKIFREDGKKFNLVDLRIPYFYSDWGFEVIANDMTLDGGFGGGPGTSAALITDLLLLRAKTVTGTIEKIVSGLSSPLPVGPIDSVEDGGFVNANPVFNISGFTDLLELEISTNPAFQTNDNGYIDLNPCSELNFQNFSHPEPLDGLGISLIELYCSGQTSDRYEIVGNGYNSYLGDVRVFFEFTGLTVETAAPVPVPAAGLLLLSAFGGLAMVRRRRRNSENEKF